eukprot:gi/632992127/ref/XP_007884935.1/ PREDICTED: GSK-3-binding protein-like [Callorhinchus milii]
MPRCRESFLLLEQAVTVESKEIDALVAKIGETLQLQRKPSGGGGGGGGGGVSAKQQQQHYQQQQQQQQQQHQHQQQQLQEPRVAAKRRICCISQQRSSPYRIPAPARALTARGSLYTDRRKRAAAEQHTDPHHMLQELILSGNLIKEAVRRLHAETDYVNGLADELQ